MRILYISSEAFPLIKTGGLADVSGALPSTLLKLGHDIRLLIPGYPSVLRDLQDQIHLGQIKVFQNISCGIILGKMPNSPLPVIAIQHHDLYERDGGPYIDANGNDWHDNALRFGVLSKVASLLSQPNQLMNWKADIAHCNDWQTGLTPYYLKKSGNTVTKSIFSIHNLAFQGNFSADWLQALELDAQDYNINGFEFYGQLSFLKAGIYYADQLSTVSPNYAKEIQTPAFGFGMEGLLSYKQSLLTGILNGIDTDEWDPEMDPHLPYPYQIKKMEGKALLKRALQEKMQLPVLDQTLLLGIVSRLTNQKGIDVILDAIPEMMKMNCQLVVLGSGDKSFESRLQQLSRQYPNQIAVQIGYNEPLSHLIMAGIDAFLMPSRFEPCGLNQLYGLRYGSPPIVSNTGGLADSICDTTDATLNNQQANGFVMENVTKLSLLVTLQRVFNSWNDKKAWKSLQKNGMGRNVGWENSANAYLALYSKAIES